MAFIARTPTTTATTSRAPSPTGPHDNFRPPAVRAVSTSDPSESVTRARPLPLSTSDRRDHSGTRAVTSCAASSGCSRRPRDSGSHALIVVVVAGERRGERIRHHEAAGGHQQLADTPHLGVDDTALVAREALGSGEGIREGGVDHEGCYHAVVWSRTGVGSTSVRSCAGRTPDTLGSISQRIRRHDGWLAGR